MRKFIAVQYFVFARSMTQKKLDRMYFSYRTTVQVHSQNMLKCVSMHTLIASWFHTYAAKLQNTLVSIERTVALQNIIQLETGSECEDQTKG